jgi:hypothetical protein
MSDQAETRRRSAALFGNEKTAEVVLALNDARLATAQQLSTSTGIAHSMVRNALARLVQGGAVRALPKTGHSRSEQYYQPVDDRLWGALVAVAEVLKEKQQLS